MSRPLSIVVFSAAQNAKVVREIRSELVVYGHEVHEWTAQSNVFLKSRIDDGPFPLEKEEDDLFQDCRTRTALADLLVIAAPLDQDAACLMCIAHTVGVAVAVVAGLNDKLGFMAKGCVSFWCDGVGAVLEVIDNWAELDDLTVEVA